MSKKYYESPKPTRLMRMFWKAAGADRYILERSTYSDQIKYVCMGGIVVATGAMAALAGGYAFYTIFEPKGDALDSMVLAENIKDKLNYVHLPTVIKATVFGLIWGLIIFNIDRFIVTSSGKGDGTEAITVKELKGAIPRILMGMIIAMTISKPIEIRMFKTEIDVKLHQKQIESQQAFQKHIDSLYSADIKNKELLIAKQKRRINQLDSISDNLKGLVAYENSHGGCHGKCEEFKKELDANQTETNTIKQDPDYIKVKNELDSLNVRRSKDLNSSGKVAAGLDGLLERLRICDEPDVAGGWITFFITLLFMAIELTPIFFKLMLIKGPYDFVDENIKELIKAEHSIEIQHDYYKDKEGQQRDLVIHHEAKKLFEEKSKLIAAQRELNEYAINKWKEQQKKNIDNDLDAFISEDR